MSFAGPPPSGPITVNDFFTRAIEEKDAANRRRLFADARHSNPSSYLLWVKAAEVEEHYGADQSKLKELLSRGVTVFKNPAGTGCTENHDHSQHGFTGGAVDKKTWLKVADDAAEDDKSKKTAAALREVVGEV
ncbi:hypothetical protein BGZ83_010067, partial [Gryganskiella cystojenkinii]